MTISFLGDKKREDFPQFEELFGFIENYMGYLPNSYLLMGEKPELMNAFSALTTSIFSSNEISNELKQLIALASSLSSGCKYCQSHTSHGAERAGVPLEKIVAILNYSKSDLYSNEEKAVLNLAFASGSAPNNANQKHFDELKQYYSDSQITDIVAVISLFGFLNRWNDTFGTQIESMPSDFVENELLPNGWKS